MTVNSIFARSKRNVCACGAALLIVVLYYAMMRTGGVVFHRTRRDLRTSLECQAFFSDKDTTRMFDTTERMFATTVFIFAIFMSFLVYLAYCFTGTMYTTIDLGIALFMYIFLILIVWWNSIEMGNIQDMYALIKDRIKDCPPEITRRARSFIEAFERLEVVLQVMQVFIFIYTIVILMIVLYRMYCTTDLYEEFQMRWLTDIEKSGNYENRLSKDDKKECTVCITEHENMDISIPIMKDKPSGKPYMCRAGHFVCNDCAESVMTRSNQILFSFVRNNIVLTPGDVMGQQYMKVFPECRKPDNSGFLAGFMKVHDEPYDGDGDVNLSLLGGRN